MNGLFLTSNNFLLVLINTLSIYLQIFLPLSSFTIIMIATSFKQNDKTY